MFGVLTSHPPRLLTTVTLVTCTRLANCQNVKTALGCVLVLVLVLVLHCCVVIGSVRYQQWLLNNELATPGEIDRDAGLITRLHSARLLLTINILHTMLIHCSPHTMGQELDTLSSGHCD